MLGRCCGPHGMAPVAARPRRFARTRAAGSTHRVGGRSRAASRRRWIGALWRLLLERQGIVRDGSGGGRRRIRRVYGACAPR
jgi:hypothetical protein